MPAVPSMTPIERDRLTAVETNASNLKDDVAEIKGDVKAVLTQFVEIRTQMAEARGIGNGVKMTIGGISMAGGAFGGYLMSFLHAKGGA